VGQRLVCGLFIFALSSPGGQVEVAGGSPCRLGDWNYFSEVVMISVPGLVPSRLSFPDIRSPLFQKHLQDTPRDQREPNRCQYYSQPALGHVIAKAHANPKQHKCRHQLDNLWSQR